MLRIILCGCIVMLINGCGTLTTVLRDDSHTVRVLKQNRTYCQSLPRVYSGVCYNACMLYGEPTHPDNWTIDESGPVLLLDIVFSGVLDTVFLPYTLYRQHEDGSILIR